MSEQLNPSEPMGIKDWVDFLFKKIEQISRQNTISGVTNWGLMGLLIASLATAYGILPAYDLAKHANELVVVWVMAGFLLLFVYGFYEFLHMPGVFSRTPPATTLYAVESPHFLASLILVSAIGLLMVLATIQSAAFLGISTGWCILFVALLALQLVVPVTMFVFARAGIPILFGSFVKNIRSGRKIALTLLFAFRANPIVLAVLLLSEYFQRFFHANGYLRAQMLDTVSLSLLFWGAATILAVLILHRRSTFVISALSSLQNKIITGRVSDTKEISRSYEDIVIGQTLSRWLGTYWLSIVFRHKQWSDMIKDIANHMRVQQEIMKSAGCKSRSEDWKPGALCQQCCAENKIILDMNTRFKALSKDALRMIEKARFILALYWHRMADQDASLIEERVKELEALVHEAKQSITPYASDQIPG